MYAINLMSSEIIPFSVLIVNLLILNLVCESQLYKFNNLWCVFLNLICLCIEFITSGGNADISHLTV